MLVFGDSSTGTYDVPTDVYDTAMNQYRSGDTKGAINTVANAVGVKPQYLNALVDTESSFNPQAKSDAGALGFTQLMPDTAKSLGVDPTNPIQNLFGGAIYFNAKLKQAGNFIGAYNLYYGLGGKAPVLATDKAAMDRIAKVAAKYGISGAEGASSTTAPNQQQINIKLADPTPYADTMKASQEKSNKILGDISDVIKNAQKPLDDAYSEVEKTYNDYLSKSKEAPTYADIEKPKNALQGFFKVALPMLLTLSAFISPGKYGYRSALAAYTWKALQANDMEKYKLAINDWKDQMAQLKDETQARLGAIKAKIDRITNNINLTSKEKELELTQANNEYKIAAEGYNAINGMNEKLQTGILNYQGRGITANATIEAANIAAKAKEYAADKAAAAKGNKNSGSGSNTPGGKITSGELPGRLPLTWITDGGNIKAEMSGRLSYYLNTVAGGLTYDLLKKIQENPNTPLHTLIKQEGPTFRSLLQSINPALGAMIDNPSYSQYFWNVLDQLEAQMPQIDKTYSATDSDTQDQKASYIKKEIINLMLQNVVKNVPLPSIVFANTDYLLKEILQSNTLDTAKGFMIGNGTYNLNAVPPTPTNKNSNQSSGQPEVDYSSGNSLRN